MSSFDDLPWRLLSSEKNEQELKLLCVFATALNKPRRPQRHTGLISDALWIPEITSFLTKFAMRMGVKPSNIRIEYCLDSDIIEERITEEELSEFNILISGSSYENEFLEKVQKELYPFLYATFEDEAQRLVTHPEWNDKTKNPKEYSYSDYKAGRFAGTLQILANYYAKKLSKPERLMIITAGIKRQGTIAALKTVYSYLTTPLFKQPRIDCVSMKLEKRVPALELNKEVPNIPVRVICGKVEEEYVRTAEEYRLRLSNIEFLE